LLEEKRRNIDPFDFVQNFDTIKAMSQTPESSIRDFDKKGSYDDYKKMTSNIYKPFFKTNKKMFLKNSFDGFGIKSFPSDNIKDVINNEYGRRNEFLQHTKQEYFQNLKTTHLTKARHTKASKMRDAAIKQNQENSFNINNKKQTFKLKQFINVPSSEFIRSIKRKYRTKREQKYSGASLNPDIPL